MSQTEFPADWDEQKVWRVLAHYEAQTEEDALAEDEAGIQPFGHQVVPPDPTELA
jgi:hypothetical protein